MESIFKGTPTRDGRIYYYRIQVNGRRITSQKYKTKEECINALSHFVLEEKNPINKKFSLVAEDYFKYLESCKKTSTVFSYTQDYKKHLEPYFKDKSINKINIQDIKKWAENLAKNGFKVSYMNKILNVLKSIFDYGMKNYDLKSNPAAVYGRFKEKNDTIKNDNEKLRYITLDEFNKFISVVDDPLWRTFFITAFYTGARKGELQALKWADVDFNNKQIEINKTLCVKNKGGAILTSTKTNKNRKIKMSKTLYDALLNYKDSQMKYTDYTDSWFVFGSPVYIPPTTIDRYKHKYFQLSGIKEITMHEFRHSHVSLLINEYIKSGQTDTAKFFLMMSNRMGHSIDVMQRTYMHLIPSVQDEIVDLLDNL